MTSAEFDNMPEIAREAMAEVHEMTAGLECPVCYMSRHREGCSFLLFLTERASTRLRSSKSPVEIMLPFLRLFAAAIAGPKSVLPPPPKEVSSRVPKEGQKTTNVTDALVDFFKVLREDAGNTAKLHETWVELEYWLFIVQTQPDLDDSRLPMAEVGKERADHLECVGKFDECRACLARIVETLGPDSYEGAWYEWLIEHAGKLTSSRA